MRTLDKDLDGMFWKIILVSLSSLYEFGLLVGAFHHIAKEES